MEQGTVQGKEKGPVRMYARQSGRGAWDHLRGKVRG